MPSSGPSLKSRIDEDLKAAMKAGDKAQVAALRLITAAIKQVEVDQKTELDDAGLTALLDKMAKQRRESIEQFAQAGRDDLVEQETYELDRISGYLPEPLSEEEIEARVRAAIDETGASSIKDMGRVMGLLKPDLQGRADMAAVSARVKAALGG